MTQDLQIVKAKENPNPSIGGPSQIQASGTNQHLKTLRQGHR